MLQVGNHGLQQAVRDTCADLFAERGGDDSLRDLDMLKWDFTSDSAEDKAFSDQLLETVYVTYANSNKADSASRRWLRLVDVDTDPEAQGITATTERERMLQVICKFIWLFFL